MFGIEMIGINLAVALMASEEEKAKWPTRQPDYDPVKDRQQALANLYAASASMNFMAMAFSPHPEIVEMCAKGWAEDMGKSIMHSIEPALRSVGLEPPP